MKRIFLSAVIMTMSLFVHAQDGMKTVREVQTINAGWQFRLDDDSSAVNGWQPVGLPHSFSIPYFMSKDFYVGYGWYRKMIRLTANDMRQRLSLEFDGVFQEAEVYVNGELAGSHRGGYTAFSVDFTSKAHKGDNLIAVRVNNLWCPVLAPRGGEHVFSGGIYRNVRLVRKSAVAHIRQNGIRITTPTLERNNGKSSVVAVDMDVENISARKLRAELEIKDASGAVITRLKKESCQIVTDEITKLHLWSPTSPYLYKATVRLYDGNRLIDEETQTFGFRWFKWTVNDGFFLNGSHLQLRGANVHQDQAGWGDAVTDEAARRDVRMMKEAGFNMIRGSHYPHSLAFVDECDRQGILFWSEAPFWGTAGPKDDGWWTASAYPVNPNDTAAFEASCIQQLEEMIRMHFNHPSVFVWSMCNEPFFTDGRTMPGVRRLLKRMVAHTHKLDPTRPAAIGGAQRPLGAERIDLIGDVAGYNGDGANIPDFQHPDVANMVSEYGSVTSDRPGKYCANWGDLNRDEGWKGRQWRGGHAIWCGFDHGSIFGDNLGKMGIVDYFRLPKRSWYWYRNEYMHIAPPEWPVHGKPAAVRLYASKNKGIRADGTDDVQLTVSVVDAEGRELSNTPDVTLKIISGPGEFPTGRTITFSAGSDIRIQDGKAAISMRSYYAGHTVVESSADGLESSRVELEFVGAPDYVPGLSPQTEQRNYRKYVKNDEQAQTYGINSPAFASSSAIGHSPGLAADGDNSTYWQPLADGKESFWMLDTERGMSISQVRILFADNVSSARVEVSADREHWDRIFDISSKQEVTNTLANPVTARFVRIVFPAQVCPKLSEVSVVGKINAN